MSDERETVEAFLREPPASPAWLEIRAPRPSVDHGGLVTVHAAEVRCEEGAFPVSWTVDGTRDRITVHVEVRPPLVDEAHLEPALRFVDAVLRHSAACAWFLDDDDRVVARTSACFRHLGLSMRLLQSTTEEAIMEARTYGALLEEVLLGLRSMEEALSALAAER